MIFKTPLKRPKIGFQHRKNTRLIQEYLTSVGEGLGRLVVKFVPDLDGLNYTECSTSSWKLETTLR